MSNSGKGGEIVVILWQMQTYIPSKKLWVSTVNHNQTIGLNRTAETMVFEGDENGVTDWGERDFEDLGMNPSKDELEIAHKCMVEKWSK